MSKWAYASVCVRQMNIFTACVKKMDSDRSKGNKKWTYSSSRNNHTIKTLCVLKVLGDTNWAIKTGLNEKKLFEIIEYLNKWKTMFVSNLLKWISKISVSRLFFSHKAWIYQHKYVYLLHDLGYFAAEFKVICHAQVDFYCLK